MPMDEGRNNEETPPTGKPQQHEAEGFSGRQFAGCRTGESPSVCKELVQFAHQMGILTRYYKYLKLKYFVSRQTHDVT